MPKLEIPRKAVYRLSLYYRALQRFNAGNTTREGEAAGATVSSSALAMAAGVKPTQLRKDLAHLGQLGTRGLGYDIARLTRTLREALGTARLQPVALVGAGHLGSALMRYRGFEKEGFEIVAGFDIAANVPATAATPAAAPPPPGVPVFPMEALPAFIRKRQVKLAILAVPATVAQEVANGLVAAGIQAILNFAPTILQVPERVGVNNVDLAIELENLSYFIR